MVDAVAELHDHVGALSARRRLEAARLELLGDEPRVALELEAAVGCHAAGGNDEEGLALWRGHRLVARNGCVDLLGAGRHRDDGSAQAKRSNDLTDTHVTSP